VVSSAWRIGAAALVHPMARRAVALAVFTQTGRVLQLILSLSVSWQVMLAEKLACSGSGLVIQTIVARQGLPPELHIWGTAR